MGSVLAIVSKAVFSKQMKDAALGKTFATKAYVSKNRGLQPLEEGGDLYLLTVRPGDVAWLVAVLRKPSFDGAQWNAKANVVPIQDVSGLLGQLVLANGKGIKAKPGRLGMSLQTPRALADEDVALLEAALKGGAKPTKKSPTKTAKKNSAATKKSAPKPTKKSEAKATKTKAPKPAEKPRSGAPVAWTPPGPAVTFATASEDEGPAVHEGPVPSAVRAKVAAAAKAAARGDLEAALVALLDAWEKHPAPSLGRAVRAVAPRVVSEHIAPFLADAPVKPADWDALVKADRVTDRGAMMTVMQKGAIKEINLRAPWTTEQPADPRISEAILETLERLPFRALSSKPTWKAWFQYLFEHPDAEVFARLEAMIGETFPCGASMNEWLRVQVERTVQSMVGFPFAGSDAELRAALATIRQSVRGEGATVDAAPLLQVPQVGVALEEPEDRTVAGLRVRWMEVGADGRTLLCQLRQRDGYMGRSRVSALDVTTGALRASADDGLRAAVDPAGRHFAFGTKFEVGVVDLQAKGGPRELFRRRLLPEPPPIEGKHRHTNEGVVGPLGFDPATGELLASLLWRPTFEDPLQLVIVRLEPATGEERARQSWPAAGRSATLVTFVDGCVAWLGHINLVLDAATGALLDCSTGGYGFHGLMQPLGQLDGCLAYAVVASRGFGKATDRVTAGKLVLTDPRNAFPRAEIAFEHPEHIPPRAVHRSADGRMHVLLQDLDRRNEPMGPAYFAMLESEDQEVAVPPTLLPPKKVAALAFDAEGTALVADDAGRVHRFGAGQARGGFDAAAGSVDGVGYAGELAFAINGSDLRWLDGKKAGRDRSEREVVRAAAASAERVFLGVTASIYSFPAGKKKGKRVTFGKGHAYDVRALAVLGPDRLVSVGDDHGVLIWDHGGTLVDRRTAHNAPVGAVAAHPGREHFATLGDDRTLHVWHRDRESPLRSYVLSTPATSLAWLADGSTLLLGGPEGLHGLSLADDAQTHWTETPVRAIAAHPTALAAVFASAEGQLGIWDAGGLRWSDTRLLAPPSLAFDASGQRLLVGAGRAEAPSSVVEYRVALSTEGEVAS